ncbi:MAG: hypothetical protein AAF533_02250 [Acidobacteriota bacterium]
MSGGPVGLFRAAWALAGLRLRLSRAAVRQSMVDGGMRKLAAIMGVVLPVLMAIVIGGGSLLIGVFLAVQVPDLLAGEERRPLFMIGLRLLLAVAWLVLMLLALIAPAAAAAGSLSDRTRLLLLPLERKHVHFVEVVSLAGDPSLLAAVPVLGGLCIGLHRAGLTTAALLTAVGSVLLYLSLVTCMAAATNLAQLFLRDRRRAETAALAVAVLSFIGFAPLLIPEDDFESGVKGLFGVSVEAPAEEAPVTTAEEASEGDVLELGPGDEPIDEEAVAAAAEAREAERQERRRQVFERFERFPPWLQLFPTEALARTVSVSTRDGGPIRVVPSLLAMLGTILLATSVSWRCWRSLVETTAGGPARREVDWESWRPGRLPLVSPPVSAVALTTMQFVRRTVRGKIGLFITPLSVLGISVFFRMRFRNEVSGGVSMLAERLGGMEIMMALGAFGLGILGLAAVSFNQFGILKAGLSRHFVSPVSDHQLVLGQAVGTGLLAGIAGVSSALAAVLVNGLPSVTELLILLSTLLSMLLLAAPVTTLVSLWFPKASDLKVLGAAGNPSQLGGTIGMVAKGVIMAVASLTASVALVLPSWMGLAIVAVWVLACGVAAHFALQACAGVLRRRRDQLWRVSAGH